MDFNSFLDFQHAAEYFINANKSKNRDLEMRMNLLEMALQLIEERLEKCEKRTDTYCSQQK